MSDQPDIIKTKIINSKWDAFWSDASGQLENLEPRPVLVVTTPYGAGSAEETQLVKMLQACKLTPDQYHIIHFTEETMLAWHLLRDKLNPSQIIILGVSPEQLGLSVQLMPHQVSRFNDRSWIVTGTLEQLIQYNDIKTHVWNYGLKPVFIDKIYG
jgi:hypothetical protein